MPDDFLNFPSILDSPDMRRQRMFDTLGGIGAALIQASGPTRGPPLSIPQILGYGLAGAAQGATGSEDRYLRRAMVQMQAAKTKAELEGEQGWKAMMGGAKPDPTNPGAVVAPPASAPAPMPSAQPQTMPANQQQFIQMMLPHALEISKATGLDPRLIIAQSGLETAWGRSAPGNNYFGIKGPGQELPTMEVGSGGLMPVRDSFRTYPNVGASAKDYVEFLKTNSRYQPVLAAQGLDAQIDAMGKSGYATDPDYGTKLRQIASGLPQGPQIAQGGGDAPGSPSVQPVKYQPPAMTTFNDVVQQIPPGVRQMISQMPRKDGMAYILKNYVEPGHEAVIHVPSGQVVYAPKSEIGRRQDLAPIKGAELEISRAQLANSQRKTDIDERNSKVIAGPDGRPIINEPLVAADERVSRAQGAGALEPHADKVMIDQASKEHGELQANALKARSGLAQVTRLSGLMDQVKTGRFTSTTQEIKAMAKGFGIDLEAMGIKDDVGPGQAADALSRQLALSLRDPSSGGGMPGQLSNADREYLAKMIPTLETTPEGRKLMLEYTKKMYQRQIDLAKVANDYVRSGGLKKDPAGMYATLQKFADENPLFDPSKDTPAGGMSVAPPGTIQGQGEPSVDLFDKYGLKRK